VPIQAGRAEEAGVLREKERQRERERERERERDDIYTEPKKKNMSLSMELFVESPFLHLESIESLPLCCAYRTG
jgi:hypothetical protein